MQELDTPTFRLAVAQFDQAADALQLDDNLRTRLKTPQRSLVVSVPVRRDDGRVEVFTGYRVQHDSSRVRPRAASAIILTSISAKSRLLPCG